MGSTSGVKNSVLGERSRSKSLQPQPCKVTLSLVAGYETAAFPLRTATLYLGSSEGVDLLVPIYVVECISSVNTQVAYALNNQCSPMLDIQQPKIMRDVDVDLSFVNRQTLQFHKLYRQISFWLVSVKN